MQITKDVLPVPENAATTLPEGMQDEVILDGTADDGMLVEDEVMRCFRNFTLYEPASEELIAIAKRNNALFLKSADGEDWYKVQAEFKKWTVKFTFDAAGVIRSKSLDVSSLWPLDMSVAEVAPSDVTEQLMRDTGSNFMFVDGEIVLRTYTDEEIKEQERRRINARLKEISEEMEYLQDAVDLEMATPEEEAQILALKRERVELKRRLQELDGAQASRGTFIIPNQRNWVLTKGHDFPIELLSADASLPIFNERNLDAVTVGNKNKPKRA